jgi:hypothetical protein
MGEWRGMEKWESDYDLLNNLEAGKKNKVKKKEKKVTK